MYRNTTKYGNGLYPNIHEPFDLIQFFSGVTEGKKINSSSPYFFYRFRKADYNAAEAILRQTTLQLSPDISNFFRSFFQIIENRPNNYRGAYNISLDIKTVIDNFYMIFTEERGFYVTKRNGTRENKTINILFQFLNYIIDRINDIQQFTIDISSSGFRLQLSDFDIYTIYRGIWPAIFIYTLQTFFTGYFEISQLRSNDNEVHFHLMTPLRLKLISETNSFPKINLEPFRDFKTRIHLNRSLPLVPGQRGGKTKSKSTKSKPKSTKSKPKSTKSKPKSTKSKCIK